MAPHDGIGGSDWPSEQASEDFLGDMISSLRTRQLEITWKEFQRVLHVFGINTEMPAKTLEMRKIGCYFKFQW